MNVTCHVWLKNTLQQKLDVVSYEQKGGVTIKIMHSRLPFMKCLPTHVLLMSTLSKTKRATTSPSPAAGSLIGSGPKISSLQTAKWLTDNNPSSLDWLMVFFFQYCSPCPLATQNNEHLFLSRHQIRKTVKVMTFLPFCSTADITLGLSGSLEKLSYDGLELSTQWRDDFHKPGLRAGG